MTRTDAARLAKKMRRIAALALECAEIASHTDVGEDWPAVDRILTDANEQVATLERTGYPALQ